MANKLQVKRTSISGRTPNTSDPGNTQYIDAGELALNMTDGILYTSNGSVLIPVGANQNTITVSTSISVGSNVFANALGVFPTANSVGGLLGNNTSRWNVYGNVVQGATFAVGRLYTTTISSNFEANSYTTGNILLGGVNQTGYIIVGQSVANQTLSIANGATNSNSTKTISIGQYGAAGSQTNITIGSSSSNTLITVNANNTTFSGNVKIDGGIVANGSIGSAGQTLFSNGSSVYWGSGAGTGSVTEVNSGSGLTGGPITGAGTLSVQANTGIVSNATGVYVNSAYIATIDANNASYLGGIAAIDYQLESGLADNVATLTANSANYVKANSGIVSDATGVYVNTSYIATLSANNASYLGGVAAADYQLESGLAANVATLVANSATYLDGKLEANLNVNSALYATSSDTANNASYLGGVAAADYQLESGLAANVATLAANAATYLNGKTETNLNVNNSLTSNNASYLGGVAAADYQLESGLAANVATLTANLATYIVANTGVVSNATGVYVNSSYIATLSANNATYVNGKTEGNLNVNSAVYATNSVNANNADYLDGQHGSYYAANSQLVNYALLSGATFTGNVTANNANTLLDLTVGRNLTVAGNLTITGNVTIVGANTLEIVDNFIYLNANNTTQNEDIGVAGNYNDGTYHHTGIFRDASDGFWKVFDNYGPEPDNDVNIDTTHATFHIADFWANTIHVGNTSAYSTINTTSFSGTANNSLYLGGTAAASYVQNTDSRTLSGNLTFSANVRLNGLIANGGIGTAGHVLHSDGTKVYWAADDQGVTSVATGSGLTGGTITSTGTLSVLANTGIIANATGLYVNSTYIGTLSANNASYLDGVAAANYARTDAADTFAGAVTFSANVILSSGLSANGGFGTAGHVLHSNGTATYWAADDQGVTSVAAGTGLSGGTITSTGTLSVNASYIATITSNAAITPQFSGDSVTKDDITTRTESGIYQTSTGTTAEGWPTDSTGWHHLISATHSNDTNYYAMQIAARFDTQDLYFRNTNGSGTTGWTKLMHVNNTLKVYNAAGTQVFP